MENFEDIKVGDKVILYRRYSKKVCEVERLTKNFVIVDGDKFRKADGFSTGDRGFFSSSISRATEEMIAKVEEENKRDMIIKKIKNYPLDKLSTEELEKVYELINK